MISKAETNPDLVGAVIDQGRLELVSIIGTGAYGVVYLAVDTRYNVAVHRAVKCLHKAGLDARQRHFQRREIALHQLASSHPSIVTMDRVFTEGDFLFVVMDYGEEGDLFAMITEEQRVRRLVLNALFIDSRSTLATTTWFAPCSFSSSTASRGFIA